MKVKRKILKITKSVSGGEISLPYYVIKGREKNLSVYIQGGIHGGEATYVIFHNLLKSLEKVKLRGSVTLVPICNPYAWNQRVYYYTVGKFYLRDGKDFNRNFPGKEDGTTIERLAWRLGRLAEKSQFSIDLHTTGQSKPFLIISSQKKKYLKIAKASGLTYALSVDMEEIMKKGGGMAFTHSEIKKGKTSIAFECGGHDRINKENIKRVTESLLNVLCYFGIIESSRKGKKAFQKSFLIEKTKSYYASNSGFVEYLVGLEEEFKKGKGLYRLYPSDNITRVKIIRAEEAGLMFFQANTHIVREGDSVVKVVPKNNIKKI